MQTSSKGRGKGRHNSSVAGARGGGLKRRARRSANKKEKKPRRHGGRQVCVSPSQGSAKPRARYVLSPPTRPSKTAAGAERGGGKASGGRSEKKRKKVFYGQLFDFFL